MDDTGQEHIYQTRVNLVVVNLEDIKLLAIDTSSPSQTPEYYFVKTGAHLCNGISFNAKADALCSDITISTFFFNLPEQLLPLTSIE